MIEELKNIANGFQLAGQLFKWGTTASDVYQALGMEAGSEGICAEGYGFPATSFDLQYPKIDKPVLSVRFSLAPYGKEYSANQAEQWMLEIKKVLGEPQKVSVETPDSLSGTRKNWIMKLFGWNKPAKRINPSRVILYASWDVGNAHSVGLSVYGGLRQEAAGISVGSLYLVWQDSIAAAEPYVAEYIAKENLLAAISEQNLFVQVFGLKKKQNTYFENYRWLHGLRAQDQPENFQRSIKALHAEEIITTPPKWKSLLNENSVALWQSQDHQIWGLSNSQDTIYFKAGDSYIPIQSWNAAPAKGGGYMDIVCGKFHIGDEFDSEVLKKMLIAIEEISGWSIKTSETYDV